MRASRPFFLSIPDLFSCPFLTFGHALRMALQVGDDLDDSLGPSHGMGGRMSTAPHAMLQEGFAELEAERKR